jgi:hypothetical protein
MEKKEKYLYEPHEVHQNPPTMFFLVAIKNLSGTWETPVQDA